jgi:Mg2+/Co2+ transporter CorB
VALFVLVALSAFFSSSETAIFTLPDAWVDAQTAGDRRVDTLRELRGDPHRLLVTILVGNNVVNVAIASITTVVLIERLPTGSAVTVATLLTSFVVLVFGEIVPKSYGLGHAEQWALVVAGPLRLIERLLSPLVSFFDVITRWMNARLGGESDIEQPYVDE